MANINDSAGIFVADTLDLFNRMEALVARDGDIAGAQARLEPVMQDICANIQTFDPNNESASSTTPRAQ